MEYKVVNMIFKDYSWSCEKDNQRQTPGCTEGCEVLDYINTFLKNHRLNVPGIFLSNGRRVETMLRTQLPGFVRSREHVLRWLEENWYGEARNSRGSNFGRSN